MPCECHDLLEQFTHYIILPLSIAFNTFLLIVVAKRSTKDLQAYAVVLKTTCVLDLINSSYTFVVNMVRGYRGFFNKRAFFPFVPLIRMFAKRPMVKVVDANF